jgi:4-amino-4-deoxy-L-arabinose transferase-like glycosyltransferase
MIDSARAFIVEDRITSKPRFFAILTLLILAISFSGLNGSLQNVDESIFAFVSRDSLEQNSWLIQIDRGTPTFFKSPMVFWANMLSFRIFGVSDFAGKLPSALANIAAAFALFFICRRVFNSNRTALMAVLIYQCSIQVHISSHQICTDVYYQAFLLVSLLFCLRGLDDRPAWFLIAGVANGLVFLSKSALGLVVPATLLLYILFERRWSLIPHLILFFLVSLAVSLPFFIAAYMKQPEMFRANFIDLYLLKVVRREGSFNPFKILYGFVYYFVLLIVMLLPFTPGLLHLFLRRRETVKTRQIIWQGNAKLLSLFFITCYFGFSVIPQRMAHYTLPMIPSLAMFIAVTYGDTGNTRRVYLPQLALSAVALAIFSGFAILEAHRYPSWIDVAFGLIAIYTVFIGLNLLFYVKRIAAPVGPFFLVLLFFISFTIFAAVTVPMDFNRDIRNFKSLYRYPAPIYVVRSKEVNEGGKSHPLYWYMRKDPVEFHDFEAFAGAVDAIERGSYIIYDKGYSDSMRELLPSFEPMKTGKIWNLGRYD